MLSGLQHNLENKGNMYFKDCDIPQSESAQLLQRLRSHDSFSGKIGRSRTLEELGLIVDKDNVLPESEVKRYMVGVGESLDDRCCSLERVVSRRLSNGNSKSLSNATSAEVEKVKVQAIPEGKSYAVQGRPGADSAATLDKSTGSDAAPRRQPGGTAIPEETSILKFSKEYILLLDKCGQDSSEARIHLQLQT